MLEAYIGLGSDQAGRPLLSERERELDRRGIVDPDLRELYDRLFLAAWAQNKAIDEKEREARKQQGQGSSLGPGVS